MNESDVAQCVVAKETMLQMLSRLDYMTLQPELILVPGQENKEEQILLKQYYPDAQIMIDTTQINSVDLIFSNELLFCFADFKNLFQKWRYVLKPNGLLMFAVLGPDTLRELRDKATLPAFIDMHDLGDELLKVGFLDPVMDAEHLTLTYRLETKLIQELNASRILSAEIEIKPPLFKNADHLYPLTYEIIYGHAWGASERYRADDQGVTKIPVSVLKKKT